MPIKKLNQVHPQLRKTAMRMSLLLPIHSIFVLKMAKLSCNLMRFSHTRKLRFEQKKIGRPDGTSLRICIYAPLEPKENVPGLLWIHGGGYAIGVPEMDEKYILRFINASGCVVVSPDYTLSPDAPYPQALYDCYASLLWLRDNGQDYGMRCDQIFIGGDSAGGGLTAALSLYARDLGEVPIAFQMPLFPMIDDRETPSNTNNHAPIWDSQANDMSWKLYLGDLYRTSGVPIYAAPGRATDLHSLPPTCTFIGSIEPFRDETLAYCEKLRNAGIEVFVREYDGCFHNFDFLGGKAEISAQATAFLMETFEYATKYFFAPIKEEQYDRL
jgi:acetyl esterase/lipase